MEHFTLNLPFGSIFCRRFGSGPKLLLALHGYHQDGAAFEPLAHQIGAHYTVIAPDLPFHGQTQWKLNEFQPSDLTALIGTILDGERQSTMELLGYSLGGRLSLYLSLRQFVQPTRLWLLAPDGVAGRWNWLSDRMPQSWQNQVAQWARRPERLTDLARWLHKLGLIDRFAFSFVTLHLRNPARRERLFRTWQSLQYFHLDKGLLQFPLPMKTEIIIGQQEELLQLQKLKRIISQWPTSSLHLISADHHRLLQAPDLPEPFL